MQQITRLTKSDLAAIEARIQAEVGALGDEPTLEIILEPEIQLLGHAPNLESLEQEGYAESAWFNSALNFVSNTGRVITLLIAETIQSLAALIIGVVFAVLEFWRVYHGASALGQSEQQAALIAFAIVTANVVHPIYALRSLRGKDHLEIVKMTGRGYLETFWRRLAGKPTSEQVDWSHNPTLHFAAMVITLTTIVIAVFDLLNPILYRIFGGEVAGASNDPTGIMMIKLVMGLGLSLAGVYFLQSAAHEIGVRTLTDQPVRLAELLATRKAAYDRQLMEAQQRARLELERVRLERADKVATIRQQITNEHMAAKLADEQRRGAAKAESVDPRPFGNIPLVPVEVVSIPTTQYGNGHIGNGKNVTK